MCFGVFMDRLRRVFGSVLSMRLEGLKPMNKINEHFYGGIFKYALVVSIFCMFSYFDPDGGF